MKIKHCVIFYSPGTLFCESTEKSIKAWNPKTAIRMAKSVEERHGAKPFGFRFSTYSTWNKIIKNGVEYKANPKRKRESGMYYITGKVLTLKNIPDNKENSTLRSNMKCNGMKAAVENCNSYKHTGEFKKEDVVVNLQGKIIARGKDYYK